VRVTFEFLPLAGIQDRQGMGIAQYGDRLGHDGSKAGK
jgi:hypothetical protein